MVEPKPSFGGENVTGFWGYDEIQLRAPTDVMDERRADALEGIAEGSFSTLAEAVNHYDGLCENQAEEERE